MFPKKLKEDDIFAMITGIFFSSLLLLLYTYIGYPLVAGLLATIKPRKVEKAPFEPHVSIVIAAFNEEAGIAGTLENKLSLNYPKDKLEIVVISDASSDSTDDIVNQYAAKGVRLLRQEPRAGKTSALNLAIPQLKGEIIVFSDANSIYAPDALRHLMGNFSDPEVGYVSGKMVYVNPDGSPIGDGCSSYMKYENLLRRIETQLSSVVGVDGGIDAVRKSLYRPMNPDQLPDFVLPLKVVEQGYRVVFEPDAILKEVALNDPDDEYRMRVRVSLRAFWAIFDMKQLLLNLKNPLFSWQLLSHKLLRYLCFAFLVLIFVSNLLLIGSGWFFNVFFIFQVICYLAVVIAPIIESRNISNSFIVLSRYFFLLNLASGHAFLKFILRQKQVTWTPRKG